VWGGIADALSASHGPAHRTGLRIDERLALSQAKNFALLVALVAVYAFFFSPVLPLIDSAALEAAEACAFLR
jgi:hypothetical protein